MAGAVFDNSDSVRSGEPLKYARRLLIREPFDLDCGCALPEVALTYETYGTLNAAADNAVLVCHALSGDSHVAAHDDRDDPGWWDLVVGPGRAIDTDRSFVICANALGGCRGTTGPGDINPESGQVWGPDFPQITMADFVRLQHRLVSELGISQLLAVVGGSMGGQHAMLWPVLYPDALRAVAVIASTARLTSQALAFDVVGRNAIINDPSFHGGRYYDCDDKPATGLAIARMIGHVTYLSREAMVRKFDDDRRHIRNISESFEQEFSVGSYLGYQGEKFVDRFDANSYIALSKAMDLFDPADQFGSLSDAFGRSRCRWLVMSFSSDWLFPPSESRRIVDTLLALDKSVSYCNIESRSGHDAFLLAEEVLTFTPMLAGFLANSSGDSAAADCCTGDESCDGGEIESSPSVFHAKNPQRLDYEHIIDLIPPSASVLDLGCGKGGLLCRLTRLAERDENENSGKRIMGVELDQKSVIQAVRCGLDVIHADLNDGLAAFGDKQFDVVVLSHTLQSIRDVDEVISEMLRVGVRCIVSFPNFGYHKLRRMLFDDGRAPVSGGLLSYSWYDTPNMRFFTIADFQDYCTDHGIRVDRSIFLDTESRSEISAGNDPNSAADMAIFVIS